MPRWQNPVVGEVWHGERDSLRASQVTRASQSEYCGGLEPIRKPLPARASRFKAARAKLGYEIPGLGALYFKMPQTISLCMIAKNEEKFLEQCINSVKAIADEIIIVDTGSTDRTKDIAKKYGAKIFDFKWIDDFSAARNESLRHSTKDWILVLDADEVIEKEDLKKIKDAIENAESDLAGFQMEQRSYINKFFEGAVKPEKIRGMRVSLRTRSQLPDFLGHENQKDFRWNNSGFELVSGYPYYIPHFLVRLFKNNLGLKFKHKVHELIEGSIIEKNLKYKKLGVVLHHFGSIKDARLTGEKTEQYSKIILKQLEEEPENPRYNYQAARMFLGRNDFGNALKYFEKTAELNPNYKLVFSEMAKIYLQMNDKNRAIEYFKKSMKHNPENPSPANNLAVVYMSMGKFEQAKKILEGQLKKHTDNKALKYNYEKCLKNIKY